MLTPSARRALTRDMSECWRELNTTLQLIGHGATQGIYGKGRRRGRTPSIDVRELLEDIELGGVV